MHSHAYCSIIYNSQDENKPCPLMDKWIENMPHTHTGILFSHKKNEILLFATPWMDLEGIIREICQTMNDKY